MTGMLESLLTDMFGKPSIVGTSQFSEYRWNEADDACKCSLYKKADRSAGIASHPSELKAVYGDVVGGLILRDSLKVSLLQDCEVWGLSTIQQLHAHPNVIRALQLRPGIFYFMDSANVWYYGVMNDVLFVYDVEPDQVEELGPVQSELERLVRDWHAACRGIA